MVTADCTQMAGIAVILSYILSFVAFYVDFLSPAGYTEWVFYLIPLLCVSFTNNTKHLFRVALLNSVLLLTGYFFSEKITDRIVIFHRILGIGIIWSVSINIFRRTKAQLWLNDNQQRLKESQQDLNRAQIIAKIGSWHIDISNNEVLWSEEARRIFDTPVGTPMNYESFLSKIHPDDRENVKNKWNAALTGSPYDIEHRIIVGNTTKWVHEKAELEFDSHGSLTCGFGTVQDITDRKEMVETIADQAKFFLENPNPVLRISSEGTIIFGNDASRKIINVWTGRTGIVILEPWRTTIMDSFLNEQQKIIEFQIDEQTFSLQIVPVTGQNYINVYGREITERKRAEKALKNSEEKYRLLFTNTLNGTALHEIITAADNSVVDYRFLEVNPAFEQMVGLKSEAIIGKTARELFPGIEKDPADWIGKYGQVALKSEKIRFEQFFTLLKKWFKVVAFKTMERQFSVMIEDITDQRKVFQELQESENRLKILNENLENIVVQRTRQVRVLSKALTLAEQRERKRFSYILHENLQQQLLGAGLLLRQHLAEHKVAAEVEEYDDVADGLRLLEKALQTAKTLSIELNPPILNTEGLDLALEWLVKHMKLNYGLRVDFHKSREAELVKNETQLMLTQMVRELLYNVVEHSGVHSARLEVFCKNDTMQITVSDRGKGFNPDEVLVEDSNKTRLGLLSIRERLRLFGGDLMIDSEINKGTRMVILLPVEVCKRMKNEE
jgi:PAS domain S-box-containing protein